MDEAAQRGAFGPGAAPRALYPDTGSLLPPHNLLHCVFISQLLFLLSAIISFRKGMNYSSQTSALLLLCRAGRVLTTPVAVYREYNTPLCESLRNLEIFVGVFFIESL